MTKDAIPGFGFQYGYGSHKGPEPPRFNPFCGHPMTAPYERPRDRAFDPVTGERLTETVVRCDVAWLRRLGCWHAVQDRHGDWPWSH